MNTFEQPFFLSDQNFADAQQQEAARKRRITTIIGVVIGLLILAGLGVLIWYLVTKDQPKQEIGEKQGSVPTKDQLRAKANLKQPVSGVAANCASANDCDNCKEGFGPNLEQYGEMLLKGVDDKDIPPLCTAKQDFLYRQTVDRYGTKFDSDNVVGPSACIAEFGAQSQFVGESLVLPFRNVAGKKDDKALSFAEFSDQMTNRGRGAASGASVADSGGARYFTCREKGFIATSSCSAEKANFQLPDCASKCVEGFGPAPGPGVSNPCSKSGYVKGFEYRLHGECYDNTWLAKNKPCGVGEEFVELVPQGHANENLVGKFQSYAALAALIKGNSSNNILPCGNGMQSAICRRAAWILPEDQETAAQESVRLTKQFENRTAEKAAEATSVATNFSAAKDDYTTLLKENLSARVNIDPKTGESKGGYFANMIPLYEQANPNVPLPLLAAEAQKSFNSLSSAAKQKVAFDFVGQEGSLNADQANAICEKRRLLSDYRDAVAAYLKSSFNEFQSWPPQTIPNIFLNKYNSTTGSFDVSLICK